MRRYVSRFQHRSDLWLLNVAQLCDDFQHLFVSDVTTAILQFVVVDRFSQLTSGRREPVMGVAELSAFNGTSGIGQGWRRSTNSVAGAA